METTFLVLEDTSIFPGFGFGTPAPLISELDQASAIGEVVFNTSMSGYQEILTDPSYHGQMVVMTYPHIGNYGCEQLFNESTHCQKAVPAAAFIVHSVYQGPLPLKRVSLDAFMKASNVCGISGVDTRSLTLHLREQGSCKGLLVRKEGESLTEAELQQIFLTMQAFPSLTERNLIDGICVTEPIIDPPSPIPTPQNPTLRFALIDFGIKSSIITELYKRNCAVTLLNSHATKEEVLHQNCDALFLSNGPGDPALLQDAVTMTREIMELLPVVGICLGHQIITWAIGGKTVKMKFGHHGGNHPVRDLYTNRTFVTSQNHGFMSEKESLPDTVDCWFVNANDGSIEGLRHKTKPVACVQFHPEASPGPHDGTWIFDRFIQIAKGENA